MQHLGQTRSSVQPNHMLLTPDSFIRSPLPGFVRATCIVHIAPQCGAAFVQYTAELQADGRFGPAPQGSSRVVYVTSGTLTLETEGQSHPLNVGGYAYLPPDLEHVLHSELGAVATVFEKPFVETDSLEAPEMLWGNVADIVGTPLIGNETVMVKMLLPDDPRFDFAVNLMSYPAGSSLHLVEIHVMEHGLLMLSGEGTYKLGDHFYPVTAGDVIYMAPYCPQWFGALGATPSSYLLYKDVNRHPLEQF